jgi:hypothetical protein
MSNMHDKQDAALVFANKDNALVGDSEVSGTEPVHLERNFSFLSCLGMAFAMLNSWTGE